MDDVDWKSTPLGPREGWPPTLQYAVRQCLVSGFATLIWWGPELIQVYNDAFAQIAGKRHPAALGQRAADCWPEIWGDVSAILARVSETGVAFSAQDRRFDIERNGYLEETYFTISYSRLEDDDGGVGGIIINATETTASVLRERDFRQLGNSIPSIVFTHSVGGVTEWANKRWYDFSRLPADVALTPDGWQRVMVPEELDAMLAAMTQAFASETPYQVDVRLRPAGSEDDAYRWFTVRAEAIRSDDGAVVRWVGSATDIHDSRIASEALRAKLELELDASRAFQAAALPQALPAVPGLVFDAVYEPAGAQALVGGDWYDAFALPDGRLVLSVGDVMGSGLAAAVTMAAVRQSIRGAAQIYPDPTAVLDAADRALRSEKPDAIVTAFVAVLDPFTLAMTYASAGHPAPFIGDADGTVRELSAVDLPLGLREQRHLQHGVNGRTVLKDGSLLVLFTDGLTESTRDALDGERRVREAITVEAVAGSDDAAVRIRAAMPPSPNDDLAILTVRTALRPGETLSRWRFDADDATTAMHARREIGERLRHNGCTPSEALDAEVIFGELLGNVVRHTPDGVEAALDFTGESPVLHVFDRGPGFQFYARLPSDAMSESGRGLYIASALARELTIVPRSDGGSHVRAVLSAPKKLSA